MATVPLVTRILDILGNEMRHVRRYPIHSMLIIVVLVVEIVLVIERNA